MLSKNIGNEKMSISFVEFQKLLNPAIPEKFKLIYEILYYYKIDIEELVGLTTDRLVVDNSNDGILQGITLTTGRFVEITPELFKRITNYLEFNNKKWGSPDTKITKNNLNYVFESNKKGHQYTIPTLYKKFKEHCLKVGILRDLALGSLINTDVGRFISIINSELASSNERLTVSFFSFNSDKLSSLLRYYIVHLNYEEITSYRKEKTNFGYKEIFEYPSIVLTVFSVGSEVVPEINEFEIEIETSSAIFVNGIPSDENKFLMAELISKVYDEAENKFVSFVIDDADLIIQDDVDEILQTTFRRWVHYIPIHSTELQDIDLLQTLEEFFMFILEKFNEENEYTSDSKKMELTNHDE